MSNYKQVTLKGNPVTLVGQELKVGDAAPPFQAVAQDLSLVEYKTFSDRVTILSAVPSLDTAVCDRETRTFNQEAARLSSDIEIVTISMDLPFAQKRWCGAAGIDKVKVISDHRDAAFGNAYGVLIKELRLLARAVFVVDKQGIISYIEVVPEIAEEPNYQAILETAQSLV
ncbi:MAG: thiol peroxidase [Calditrichaeota bacterium]|nr:thiol peroxidase [Calditrichota bacterium]